MIKPDDGMSKSKDFHHQSILSSELYNGGSIQMMKGLNVRVSLNSESLNLDISQLLKLCKKTWQNWI